MCDLEIIRKDFKPDRITTLFVGESPPHGGTFFYDLTNLSKLFCAVRKAFEAAQGKNFKNEGTFLDYFKECGFYLDDLVHEPINHLVRQPRREKRKKGIPCLSGRIQEYKPERIVIVMCAIEDQVREAMRLAGFTGKWDCVAFPANGNQKRFHLKMQEIIPKLPNSCNKHTV